MIPGYTQSEFITTLIGFILIVLANIFFIGIMAAVLFGWNEKDFEVKEQENADEID